MSASARQEALLPRPTLIGIDLDNTIVGYDRLFGEIAKSEGLVPADFSGSKKQLRDRLRQRPGGEERWTALQAVAYGQRIAEADLIEGVGAFLTRCRDKKIDVCIVSHKTRFAAADPDGVDLRQAALAWLERQGFFSPDGYGLARSRVYFEDTRADKCRRIAGVGCTHFIDDLEEVFLDPHYPETVEGYLFLTAGEAEPSPRYRVHSSWASIADDIQASLGGLLG